MKRAFAIAVSLLWAATAYAQEVAGRVLVSVGEVSILRAGQRIAAPTGTPVLAGDTLELGAQSNAQVRFTDDSIVALRPQTTFRISEYRFQGGKPEEGRAFFDLLKGGLRTVTGLIGRLKHENYGVTTPTATIGIRGTNYTLVQCDSNCRNPNGTIAPAGTYGAVTDGRIGVINRTGERIFGANEYFHVASLTTPAERLIAPPPFLRDTLEGRVRRERVVAQPAPREGGAQPQGGGGGTGSQSANTLAQTGASGGSGDTSVTSTVTNPTTPAPIVTNIVPVTTTVGASGPSALLQPTSTSGTVFYRLSGPFSIPVMCSSPPCSTLVMGDITLAVNLTTQRAGLRINVQGDNGATNPPTIVNAGTPLSSGGIPITVSGNQIAFSGTFNSANFPNEPGAFRICDQCSGVGGSGPSSLLISIGVNGTISGSTATLSLTGTNLNGQGQQETATFVATLTQVTPPNSLGAAMVIPEFGGGATARSEAYWGVSANSSGALQSFGPSVGAGRATIAGASATILGNDSTAGNLVWGKWSSGAQVTDNQFFTFTSTGSLPWITGSITSVLPVSLGTVTYSPISMTSGFVGAPGTVLNSASLTADFVNRDVSAIINATNTSVSNTFQMSGSSGIAVGNGRFGAKFSSISCSGPCTGPQPLGGSFAGFFAGPNAEGAGVSFSAGFGGNGVAGVIAMKR